MLAQSRLFNVIGYTAGIILVFVFGAISTNIINSALSTTALIVGYLDDAVVVGAIIDFAMRRSRISLARILAVFVICVINIIIVFFGYWAPLLIAFVCSVVLDMLILGFRK